MERRHEETANSGWLRQQELSVLTDRLPDEVLFHARGHQQSFEFWRDPKLVLSR